MLTDYRFDYLVRLPLPLAQLYRRAFNAPGAQNQHNNTYYLLEAFLKLAVAPAAAAYREEVRSGRGGVASVDRLLGNLKRPSTGDWRDLLRELARYFGGKPEAPSHPLGGLWKQLTKKRGDWLNVLALFRRIKNGVDGLPGADQRCSLLELLDRLVQYRNNVFGHAGERPASFHQEMAPLLFAAANDILADRLLDYLGPPGSRLLHLTAITTVDGSRQSAACFELLGESGVRRPPLEVPAAAGLVPNRVAVQWPGRAVPLVLHPLLVCEQTDKDVDVYFLNADRGGTLEHLSYLSGATAKGKSPAPDLTAFLGEAGEAPAAATADPGAAPAPPEFAILGEIGRGGMGVVYLARQLSLGRLVALKMLPAEAGGDARVLARLRNEVTALARCEHPNIVKVLTTGTLPDGHPYYAMEYVPGCDLEHVLQELTVANGADAAATLAGSTWDKAVRSATVKQCQQATSRPSSGPAGAAGAESAAAPLPLPPLPELPLGPDDPGGYTRRVAQLMREAALALHAVHAQGIVHRDVKPANLMLTPDGGRLVLMDFGLAKGQALALSSSQRTGRAGTLRYMAPEQLRIGKKAVGPATDVRGLGVTFWELFTRRRLFADAAGEDDLETKIHEQDVPLLRAVDASFDPDLEAIITRATERHVADRIRSAGELAEYLRLYLDHQPLPIRLPTGAERVRRWVRDHARALAGAAAVVVLVASVTAVLVSAWSRKPEPPDPLVERRQKESALTGKGLERLTSGDLTGALPCFAEALRLEPPDPPRDELNRMRFAAALRLCPRPLQLWPHDADVKTVAFDPDGRRVLTASGNAAQLWDVKTGQPCFREPLRHAKLILHAAFSPDGRLIVTAGADRLARVWDAQTGALRYELRHRLRVNYATFSPDGRRLATASGEGDGDPEPVEPDQEYGEARVWDAIRGTDVTPPLKHAHKVLTALFSPDGRFLVTNSAVSRFPPAAPAPYAYGPPPAPAADNPAPAPNGAKPKTDRADPKKAPETNTDPVQLWEVRGGKRVGGLSDVGGKVHDLSFGPDGRLRLFAGDEPRSLSLDDLTKDGKGNKPAWPAPFSQPVTHAAFSPVRDRVAVVKRNEVQIRELLPSVPVGRRPGRWPGNDRALALNGDAALVLALQPADPNVIPLRRHDKPVTSVLFSPEGRCLVTTCEDHTARLWDSDTGEALAAPMRHTAGVQRAAVSPDGRYVATVSADYQVWLWDRAVGIPLRRSVKPEPEWFSLQVHGLTAGGRQVGFLGFSAPEDGGPATRLVSAFWDVATGQGKMPAPPPFFPKGRVINAVLSPDGRYAAAVYRPGEAFPPPGKPPLPEDKTTGYEGIVWEVRAGKPVGNPLPLGPRPHLLTLTAGGKWFAVAQDQTVSVWDVATGQPAPPLQLPGEVWCLAFSPDGRWLVAGTKDGTARVWEGATGRPVAREIAIRRGKAVVQAAFSPDGGLLATVSGPPWDVPNEDEIRVWKTATGEPVTGLLQLAGLVTRVRFSPDGRFVLAASSVAGSDPRANPPKRYELRVWEARSGDPITPVLAGAPEVSDVAFSPDGRQAVVVDKWFGLQSWPLSASGASPDQLAALGKVLAQRRIDSTGSLVPLEPEEFRSAWGAERAGVPSAETAVPPDEVAAWHDAERVYCMREGLWTTAMWHADYLVRAEPKNGDHREDRGDLFALADRWEEAEREYATAGRLKGDSVGLYHKRALVRLLAKDEAGYRRFCEENRLRFGAAPDPYERSMVARTYALAGDAVRDWKPVVDLARGAAARPNPSCDNLHSLGAVLVRAGQYEEAIQQLNKAESKANHKDDPYPWDWFFLALAHDGLNDTQELTKALNEARRLMDVKLSQHGLRVFEQLELRLLRLETARLAVPAPLCHRLPGNETSSAPRGLALSTPWQCGAACRGTRPGRRGSPSIRDPGGRVVDGTPSGGTPNDICLWRRCLPRATRTGKIAQNFRVTAEPQP